MVDADEPHRCRTPATCGDQPAAASSAERIASSE
jgi:hypothetical protein